MQIQLKVINGNKSGQMITIKRSKFMIGRADDCQLKPKSELISRYHCVILSEDSYVAIRDLGSRNGVFVNGERIVSETELHNGDKLDIGPLEFEVVLSVALAAAKKPKVGSIAEAVARTVARDAEPGGAPTDEKQGGDAASWLLESEGAEAADDGVNDLMGEEDGGGDVDGAFQSLGMESEVKEKPAPTAPAASAAPKPEAAVAVSKPSAASKSAAPATGTKPSAVRAPEKTAAPAKPVDTAKSVNPTNPGQAANMLKNFFQNR